MIMLRHGFIAVASSFSRQRRLGRLPSLYHCTENRRIILHGSSSIRSIAAAGGQRRRSIICTPPQTRLPAAFSSSSSLLTSSRESVTTYSSSNNVIIKPTYLRGVQNFHTSTSLCYDDRGGGAGGGLKPKKASSRKSKRYRDRNRNRKNKNNKKNKNKTQPYEHATHGETGRLIMTKSHLDDMISSDSKEMKSIISSKDTIDQAKNLIHNAQTKELLKFKYEHVTEGRTQHDTLFFATLRSVVDTSYSSNSNSNSNNNSNSRVVELVNTGAARSKKYAETLAAVDLILDLYETLNIDIIHNPPDIKQLKKARKEEQFKLNVQRSQMILEVLNVSRPMFDTIDSYNDSTGNVVKNGYISRIRFYIRGTPIEVMGTIGRSKAEAEGNALMAVTETNGILEQYIGTKKMNEICNQIDASPGGHVAALHIPPLPEEALEIMMNALGSNDEHWERMDRHAEMKVRYEEEFHRRQRQQILRQQDDTRMTKGMDNDGKGGEGTSKLMMNQKSNEIFMKEEESRMLKATDDPEGGQGKMKSVRDALPIKAIQNDLIDALKSQQVVVVSGGTGSGKSTQCPQYILEDAISNQMGADTRIVVTQPRRIAAISVAERIANERDEQVGKSVGYTVRFNKRAPRDAASIEFVTTGVLLRRLINDPTLEGISHVMIDEVHERDIDTDFLLVLLRDLLTKRPELRVILMSATLDAESFGRYFSSHSDPTSVPVMSVPTKPRHPVEIIQLEDMADVYFERDEIPSDVRDLAKSLLRLQDQQLQFELEEAIAEDVAALKLESRSMAEDEGNISLEEENSSDSESDSDSDGEVESSQSLASKRLRALRRAVSMRSGAGGKTTKKPSTTTKQQTLSDKREISELTTRLVAKLAQHVAQVEISADRQGSVLCFLPGLDEIKEAMKILEDEVDPMLKEKMKILPLHSTIPQHDQQQVFIAADAGTVKVILSTNIAESSVTIDDVLCVVDGGLVREMNYDPEKSMSTMVTVPTSKASATQRLGRAGRVAAGRCYRIYSKGQQEAMLERPLPEIQRSALEATCLNTCTMTNDTVENFLSRAMDPPKEEAVAYAMDRLQKLGAIAVDPSSTSQKLTPLGKSLSRLPLDPAIGKMLIMGCVVQCLDPVLTAAALACSREVFFTPPGLRTEQQKKRRAFSEYSDALASLRAYNEYQDVLRDMGWDSAKQWAFENFVSINAVSSVHSIRSQLINELHRIGLVQNSDLDSRSRGRNKQLRANALVNRNADVESLYTAVWAVGAPDNLAARRRLGSFGTLRTKTEQHAGLHPSAVAFHRKPPRERHALPPWFLYREMVLSSQVFIRGCTALSPEQTMLFGGYELCGDNSDGGKGQRVIDDWIIVEGDQCIDSLDVLANARREINAALDLKVMKPRRPLPEAQQVVIDALGECLDLLDETKY